jgi:hypothetical protein
MRCLIVSQLSLLLAHLLTTQFLYLLVAQGQFWLIISSLSFPLLFIIVIVLLILIFILYFLNQSLLLLLF